MTENRRGIRKGEKLSKRKFIVYLRVSTKEQGDSKLGLEAQKSRIYDYIRKEKGEVAETITEVGSGKTNTRPGLNRALQLCEQYEYTLIISTLDRLGRNASYLFQIRDRIKDLVIVDAPDIDLVKFGIYAVFAQYEREKICSRIKAALKERERRTGKKLGNKKGVDLSNATRQSGKIRRQAIMLDIERNRIKTIIETELERGSTYRKIAEYLNKLGYKTTHGKSFSSGTIQKEIKLYGLRKGEKK